ncbi:UDP-glucuronate:xylan alpha-glucuronosyltransferase 1 [Carica papaya]|uniref:UDP-glucuronate:xylan alpha-glucuronosyltransferase 1 n=1 Tax=Carica papaya TaxID=3649 RepID=UPI000B8CCC3F|nr:UDP-glucuronate:xylan alpha-glucuronosyltransferase 1 [Carica papaya]
MRGAMTNSSAPSEPRYRLSASIEDIYKKRIQRSKVKSVDKPLHIPFQDRSSCCKFPLLKLVLGFTILGTFLIILCSPESYHNHPSQYNYRSNFVNRWIWGGSDPQYVSNLDVNWDDVMTVIEKMGEQTDYQGIGLLNFNKNEVNQWNDAYKSNNLLNAERMYSGNGSREAYATILHSAHVYVCGAIAAAQSIRMSGSTRDLVILVDETISVYHRSGLEEAGWKIRTIKRIRNPKAEKDAYNEWNYSKFRLWQLTDYDKIIFIDADLLTLRNIDLLFSMPEISATGNNGTLFNSGVMVIEPSLCTFQLLMDHINEIESYNGGDQGYLNEIFTWWHRIPKHMNFLKHFWIGDEEEVKQKKTSLFGANPPILYVLHYLGNKPWLCYRDYDCNWNVDILQEFASDVAHERWWKVHDAMPQQLHQFCLLRSKQKAQLEWDRRQAEKANFTDRHWNIKIKDLRLKKCIDKLCSWKSMLKHWGETNWTDDEFFTPTPPAITTAYLPQL